MADALDPRTQWVYQTARERTDSIELADFYSWQIHEVLSLFPRATANKRELEAKDATPLLYGEPANSLARYLVHNLNSIPIRSILKSLLRHGTVSALVESPYLDLEFWDMHAGFYDKCFREHARHCIRVHFFSLGALCDQCKTPSTGEDHRQEAELLEELRNLFYSGIAWADIQKKFVSLGTVCYLGYMILRPTLSFSVARAAIRFDDRTEGELCVDLGLTLGDMRETVGLIPLEYGAVPFLKSSHCCHTNVLCSQLKIDTMEFMQQDPNLGACATVSLWVATRGTADKLGLNRFNYTTITRQALGELCGSGESVTFDAGNLGEGLTSEEIGIAIQRTGARALSFGPREDVARIEESMRLQQEVYSFIESGIPVILCLGDEPASDGHAVAVVGHSLPAFETVESKGFLRPANTFMKDIQPNHYLVSSLIPVYYAHDDAYGPFNRVVFYSDGGDNACQEERIKSLYPCVRRGGSVSWKSMPLNHVVAPVPPMVHAGSSERLNALIMRFDELLLKNLRKQFGEGLALLWRSLLMEGAEFKASLVRRDYSEEIREWYGRLMLPKYIWVFEVSLVDEPGTWKSHFASTGCPKPRQENREVFGEFIVDSTTSPQDSRCLAFRLKEWGFDYRRDIEHPNGKKTEVSKQFAPDKRDLLYRCYTPKDL